MKHLSESFHGYVGHFALLDDGRVVQIRGGYGSKLFVKTIDGTIEECYHDNLKYIFMEESD